MLIIDGEKFKVDVLSCKRTADFLDKHAKRTENGDLKMRLHLKPERRNKMAIKSKARHDLTLRSIKREIGAGRDVAFWLDKTYTHYDNGLLDEADIAEVETLAQAYYDAVDAETVQDGNATNEQIQNPLYEEEDQ